MWILMRILNDFWCSKGALGPSQGVRGGTKEAPRRHQGGTREAPRKHLGTHFGPLGGRDPKELQKGPWDQVKGCKETPRRHQGGKIFS